MTAMWETNTDIDRPYRHRRQPSGRRRGPHVPPYGLRSGEPGAPFRITLYCGGGGCILDGKADLEEGLGLHEGNLVTLESCGGGGFGVVGAA